MRTFFAWLVAVVVILLIVSGELKRQKRLRRSASHRPQAPMCPPRRSLLKSFLARIRRSMRRTLGIRSTKNTHTGEVAGSQSSVLPAPDDDDDDFHYHRQYYKNH